MKQILLFIVLLFGVSLVSFAQNNAADDLMTNPKASSYFSKAYVTEGTLYLYSAEKFDALTSKEKGELLNSLFKNRPQTKLSITSTKEGGEIWMKENSSYILIDSWSNYNLALDEYQPIEVKRHGRNRWYNYYGGSVSGQGGTHSLMLSYRRGTFLYGDFLDVAASLSGGAYTDGKDIDGSLAVGVSSRAYLPFRIEGVRLAPYAGIGCSVPIAPKFSFELQLLAGACWFVGPGSLDFGLQYGTKSKAVFTIGYTFRPVF